MRALTLPFLFAVASLAQEPASQAIATTERIRLAATRAVAMVQVGATGFYKTQNCFTCHSQALPMMVFRMAREHGVPVDEAAAKQVAVKGLSEFPDRTSLDAAVQDFLMVDPTSDDGWALIGLHAAGVDPNPVTAIYARRLASLQHADGHWSSAAQRPPQSYSLFTTTALVLRVLQLHMPRQSRTETAERVARARKWLLTERPVETEDYTFRLFGLFWAGASAAERGRAARELVALQKPNGGWSQLPHMQPDAYATGEALVALYETGGMLITDPVWQEGLQYLISTQDDLGAWLVRTRMISPAPVSPPYFETGFPYGRDQFLSMTGSCWAAMALIAALPKAAVPASPLPLPELSPADLQPWMTTALFGAVAELKAQLDGGLDPNSKTAEGTTVLMMAANDAAKVRLLISRGADARMQAKTGFTALHVASTYGGSAEPLKALLESGLSAQLDIRVKFNSSPLMLAVQAGDRANVALLLAHGADVKRKTNVAGMFNSSVLALAVAFGDAELAQMLLAAGADAQEKDANDMSLLHRAALGNRVDMVKLLASRGVSVNAVDRFGYTPLLYSSTVDFGDAKTTTALLAAGADPGIKDQLGKTPLEHAREFPYIRAALKKAGAKN